jgi:hypothetical protein
MFIPFQDTKKLWFVHDYVFNTVYYAMVMTTAYDQSHPNDPMRPLVTLASDSSIRVRLRYVRELGIAA